VNKFREISDQIVSSHYIYGAARGRLWSGSVRKTQWLSTGALNRGRTAGYPTAPSQIPACGISAPGSSVLLASARAEAVTRGGAEPGRAAA
jgi:hypothetical protein